MHWTSDSINVFRRDLEDLVDLFKEIKPNSTTVLSGEDGRTYESFDEMKEKEGSNVQSLSLSNEQLGIQLTLSSGTVSIVTLMNTKPSEESQLAFYKAKEFLNNHRRRVGEIIKGASLWGWVLFTFFMIESFRVHSEKGSRIVVALEIGSFIVGVGSSFFGKRLSFALTLDRKHERPAFFARKKDDLILVVFTAIITSVLSIAATLLIQRLNK
jgi:hypothetical protein